MKPLKIVEEGVIDSDARKILPGAIRWVEDKLPVFSDFVDPGSLVGSATNIRREDGWVVGDPSFDLVDPSFWTVSYLITHVVTKLDSENGCFNILDGILRNVVLVPNPANQKGQNDE